MIDLFFAKFNQISVGLLLAALFMPLIKNRLTGKADDLGEIVNTALTAAIIPTGLALIFSAFDETLLPKLGAINTHLALSGFILLYAALKIIER